MPTRTPTYPLHRTEEIVKTFDCFGSACTVIVAGRGPAGTATEAAARAQRRLLAWHDQFSRFEPTSELSALNSDPRETVEVSPMMARFAEAALDAARLTGGLVDPTLLEEIEAAGYDRHFSRPSVSLHDVLDVPSRHVAGPHPSHRWLDISVDRTAGAITRPPGLRLDSGGIAKGLFADVLSAVLTGHDRYVVDCGGDLRIGGTEGVGRLVEVQAADGDHIVHRFLLSSGAVATSGIGHRAWLDRDGRPAHHLLDPATGRPALTGVVQATALAPTAVRAEALAKAALLAGPDQLEHRLPHGGVAILDDGGVVVISAPGALTAGSGR
ncbi:MAG: hypothetical protein JWO02_2361 [Solirubrobacterales bacterium]|nr:hypothetical protein [Solirubrobacterales bacterium]